MARQSESAKAMAPFAAPRVIERLQPPADLDDEARQVWLAITAAAKEGHFAPVDAPLLASYCRSVITERMASAEIRASFPTPTRLMLKLHADAIKALHCLSMRLRLSPQSRLPNISRTSNTRAPNRSYYELMRSESAS